MSTINDIFGAAGASDPSKKNQANDKLGQEQFLQLLLTQLQNQDPMEPMENGEFLTQMAQFSTASGIQDLQKSFGELAGAMRSTQALQASSLVGRQVLAAGEVGRLSEEGALRGAVVLKEPAEAVQINVYDSQGQLVRSMLNAHAGAGELHFAWDGLDEAGNRQSPGLYRVAAAVMVEGRPIAADTLIAQDVESVSLGRAGEDATLNLAGGTSLKLRDVREIM